jgi:uncharacterized surface protein with fasciclin (FAS1) repeats
MRKRTISLLVAATAVLALMVAGPASAKTPNDARATKNIVQVASGAPQFSTLVSLIEQAGLVETLSGKGPFTVMAPTNAAFRQVPKATLDAIAADKALLTKVLTYHVVAGEVKAADVVKLNNKRVKTVEGGQWTVRVRGGKVYIDNPGGIARVTKTDIMASNGVIHSINEVLIPRSVLNALAHGG